MYMYMYAIHKDESKIRSVCYHTSVAIAFSPLIVSPSSDSKSLNDEAGSMWNMSMMWRQI